jgi:hypothetical protein
MTRTPEYAIWEQIVGRCTNEKHPSYKNYGARGIEICHEWRESFSAFIRDVGRRPGRGFTIERVNNSLGYAPGNVVWARYVDQNRNKRKLHKLTFRGETKVLTDWALEFGVSPTVLYRRLRAGWSIEDALLTPPCECGRRVWSQKQGLEPSFSFTLEARRARYTSKNRRV